MPALHTFPKSLLNEELRTSATKRICSREPSKKYQVTKSGEYGLSFREIHNRTHLPLFSEALLNEAIIERPAFHHSPSPEPWAVFLSAALSSTRRIGWQHFWRHYCFHKTESALKHCNGSMSARGGGGQESDWSQTERH